nr:MarR family transcriptional regulator [Candidatus Njordarchaeum guaymaensis]
MNLEKLNWVRGGKYRGPVLRLLEKNPMLPSEVASVLKLSRASASRILRSMEREGLIGRTKSTTRTVTYFLIEEGRQLLPYFNKIALKEDARRE